MTALVGPRNEGEALAFLESLAPSGVRLGLDRVYAALRAVRNPERDFPAVHVAGTNGKGSTCAFAATCLATQGYRVGLYTSPHLVRVNERIKVNGRDIPDETLGRRILEVLELYPEAAATPAPLTYFELGTLVALWHFSREKVDVAVLETGLGGRLDATTAARPVVTAVTPLSFDHMDYLGHTLAAIAGEKAGIFKAGVPAVSSRQPPEALEVLERVAREVGARLYLEGRDFAFEPEPGEGTRTYAYRGMRTKVPKLWPGLSGEHQIQNAAVALACLELLEDRGLPISQASARDGLAATEWPGRLEVVDGRPPLLLDGAHNPAGAAALAAALDDLRPLLAGGSEQPPVPLVLVWAAMADKDVVGTIAAVARSTALHGATVVCTAPALPRALAPDALAAAWTRAGVPRLAVRTAPSPTAALDAALALGHGAVVVAGSLYLVGAVRSRLVDDPLLSDPVAA